MYGQFIEGRSHNWRTSSIHEKYTCTASSCVVRQGRPALGSRGTNTVELTCLKRCYMASPMALLVSHRATRLVIRPLVALLQLLQEWIVASESNSCVTTHE